MLMRLHAAPKAASASALHLFVNSVVVVVVLTRLPSPVQHSAHSCCTCCLLSACLFPAQTIVSKPTPLVLAYTASCCVGGVLPCEDDACCVGAAAVCASVCLSVATIVCLIAAATGRLHVCCVGFLQEMLLRHGGQVERRLRHLRTRAHASTYLTTCFFACMCGT